MATLVWDAPGKRDYELGVSKAVLYTMTDGAYDEGVAWNGVTSISENPDGADTNDLYANNIKYGSIRAAENYAGTIEAYMYPDEWEACDGHATLGSVKGLTVGQQTRKAFGLCYRTEVGNDSEQADGASATNYKLHFIYNSTASTTEKTYETINDSPDGMTMSWDFESTPVSVTGAKATASVTLDVAKYIAGLGEGTNYLQSLLDYIYGTSTTPAKLPTPDDIAALLKSGKVSAAS